MTQHLAVLYYDIRKCDAYIKKMKAERDEKGFKLSPLALQAKESLRSREQAAL